MMLVTTSADKEVGVVREVVGVEVTTAEDMDSEDCEARVVESTSD